MFYSRILITAFLLVLAACSTPPMSTTPEFVFQNQADVTAIDPCFRFGLGILSGFDDPNPNLEWEPHSWMLLGVKITRGEHTDVWFVRLTTLPDELDDRGRELPPEFRNFVAPMGMGDVKRGQKFRLPVGRVLIKCYDQRCRLLGTSVRMVPQAPPGESLLNTCSTLELDELNSTGADWPDHKAHDVSGGLLGITSMISPIGASGALKSVRELARRDVIKQPSVLGLLVGGLRLNLTADLQSSAIVESAWSAETALTPRRQLEFPLQVGGQTLLTCRAIVGPNDPPYNLSGGILQFEAAHPQRPQNQMTVRVLAAKRMTRN